MTLICPIARNLTDALKRVLKDEIPNPFWIDAISINQTDTKERNQQVRLMTRIFMCAQQVLAWPGPDDGTLTQALALVVKWADPCNDLDLLKELLHRGINNPLQPDIFVYLIELAKATTREEWEILNAFFNHPYFKRAWIVQEVSVARELYVLCGTCTSFAFEAICASASWLTRHSKLRLLEDGRDFLQSSVVESPRVVSLWNMRRRWQNDRALPASLLKTAYQNECYDLRNKFFATHGIYDIPANVKHHFTVDYDQDLW